VRVEDNIFISNRKKAIMDFISFPHSKQHIYDEKFHDDDDDDERQGIEELYQFLR